MGIVFQKIINKKLSTYLDLQKLLSPSQLSFRKEVSTYQANPTILEEIYKKSKLKNGFTCDTRPF